MQYEARVLEGHAVRTMLLTAYSADEARAMAQEQALRVLTVRPLARLGAAQHRFDLALFSEELAELLDAGLSVVEACDALAARESTSASSPGVHQTLLKRMREGSTFAAALEAMPQLFPPLYTGLIRASEKTSDLHGALTRYLDYSRRFEALRNQISGALIYPCVLAVVGSGVIAFLLGFVVPRFAAVYQGAGKPLPLLSALLLDWGAFASRHGLLLGVGAATLFSGLGLWAYLAHRSGTLEQLLALAPPVQRRVQLFRLARFYLTVGTLLNGGVAAVPALTMARGVVGNAQRQAIDATVAAVRQGRSLTSALAQQGLTTPVSLRLLQAGEGSGRMGDLFVRAGRYHDNELARWIERFSRLFEPLLMAVIGIVVGGIVILLYIPIFDLAGSFR